MPKQRRNRIKMLPSANFTPELADAVLPYLLPKEPNQGEEPRASVTPISRGADSHGQRTRRTVSEVE